MGSQVEQFPEIYDRILNSGHSVGNHSYSHLNGWYTDEKIYIEDVKAANKYISSNLFRPPYGRIRPGQAKQIPYALNRTDAKIIMWDVLSADFDLSFTPEQCLSNVLQNVVPGSIIVFHDSQKASNNLKCALTGTLGVLHEAGYRFRKIEYSI
jgi:peptidoglycan/xylan/chitin deacetylase (PgdA/CDA1 family)